MIAKKLKEKIANRKAKVGIIGLGYVGLPLAVLFAQKGFPVFGIDINKNRIKRIKKGCSYILDVPNEELKQAISDKRLKVSEDFSVIRKLDAVIICVPTPLKDKKEPDISYIVSAVENIKKFMKKGQIIVLESTTYPGTTEEVILPRLESAGFREGRDFYLAFSPERIDPANPKYKTENTPKVIGGMSPRSSRIARELYSQIINKVVSASSCKAAEMAKLLENTFRIVNIGLVNEITLMCDKMGIDIWEVIDIAKTKPYGYMPFYPGPGVGGHCIAVDPIYLSWKARGFGFEAQFIELASHINSQMPHYVVERITRALNEYKKPVKGSRILIVGVAYKKDVKDLRESPALEIINILQNEKAVVSYYDPHLPYLNIDGIDLKSVKFTAKSFNDKDCVVIATDHSDVDYDFVLRESHLIVDTRNVFKKSEAKKVIKL
ncbi:MAG: nucleotide sugar dehydrogenase [Candidatus Omnitrophota bacterium]|nr:MAG: nucleotide sugar dehydrogenase [Candidatus Omnitrophota bacterium]